MRKHAKDHDGVLMRPCVCALITSLLVLNLLPLGVATPFSNYRPMSPIERAMRNRPEMMLFQNPRFLSPGDFERAARAPVVHPRDEELEALMKENFFEGDIAGVATGDGQRILHDAADIFLYPQNSALNLNTYPDKLWPEGRVPYQLEEGISPEERIAVAQAFEEFKQKTCIRFVPKRDDDVDYVYIRRNSDNGCSSYVGRAGGNQTVSLEIGKCFTKGIVAHELMHSIGFFHEHSRTDRDKFVIIVEDNVKPGMIRNFEKYPQRIIDNLDMPYDYGSVMHYHKLAFSKNGKATIEPVDRSANIGQRFQLSDIDSSKVNKLYKCASISAATTTPLPETTTTRFILPTLVPVIIRPTTVVKPTIPPDKETFEKCHDLNEHCEMWAEIGHCKWSEKYMTHYCRKSCKICSSPAIAPSTSQSTLLPTVAITTGETRPPSPSTPITTSETQKPTVTVPFSPLTTSETQKPTVPTSPVVITTTVVDSTCIDRNLFCGYWSRIGECGSESKFMKIFCRRSCNYCEEASFGNIGGGQSTGLGKIAPGIPFPFAAASR